MSWWNLGGLNPQYEEFAKKHPRKTMIGMSWSLYWRFGVFFFALELILFGIVTLVAALI